MFHYRYILEPYRDKGQKHICPECGRRSFVRYIDVESGEYLGSKVGRCDHENSCGYHFRPAEYLKDGNVETFKSSAAWPKVEIPLK